MNHLCSALSKKRTKLTLSYIRQKTIIELTLTITYFLAFIILKIGAAKRVPIDNPMHLVISGTRSVINLNGQISSISVLVIAITSFFVCDICTNVYVYLSLRNHLTEIAQHPSKLSMTNHYNIKFSIFNLKAINTILKME